MADVLDVAAAILENVGDTTAMKLQKLVYYSQAWHLVWEEQTLFGDDIEAWANGPVVPALYRAHRGQFRVALIEGGWADRLSPDERSTVDAVCDAYGKLAASALVDLTHREDPWSNARRGVAPGVRSNNVIAVSDMAEFYEGLSDSEPGDR